MKEIAARGYKFWIVQFNGYRSHKLDYTEAVLQLLKDVDLSDVNLIIVDKVERNWKHMAKHIEKIGRVLPGTCQLRWGIFEREKGIQVADAICGAASRRFNNIFASSYFNVVEHLCMGYKK